MPSFTDALRWSDAGTPPERRGPDLGMVQWLDVAAGAVGGGERRERRQQLLGEEVAGVGDDHESLAQ